MNLTLLFTEPKVITSFLIIILSFLLFKGCLYFLDKFAKRKKFRRRRVFYIHKITGLIFIFTDLFALSFLWSINLQIFSVVASSIFAISGIALFAQWSILSNITSSIIIFFFFPARIGDTIKIIDGDNSIQGVISEISMFQLELIDKDGNSVFYPNNMVLQKIIIKMKIPNKIEQ